MNFPTIQHDKIIMSKESLRSGDNKLASKGSAYSNARSFQFRSDVFERNIINYEGSLGSSAATNHGQLSLSST